MELRERQPTYSFYDPLVQISPEHVLHGIGLNSYTRDANGKWDEVRQVVSGSLASHRGTRIVVVARESDAAVEKATGGTPDYRLIEGQVEERYLAHVYDCTQSPCALASEINIGTATQEIKTTCLPR